MINILRKVGKIARVGGLVSSAVLIATDIVSIFKGRKKGTKIESSKETEINNGEQSQQVAS